MTPGFWFQLNNSRLGSSLPPFVFPAPGLLRVGSRSSTEILDFLENRDGLKGLFTSSRVTCLIHKSALETFIWITMRRLCRFSSGKTLDFVNFSLLQIFQFHYYLEFKKNQFSISGSHKCWESGMQLIKRKFSWNISYYTRREWFQTEFIVFH